MKRKPVKRNRRWVDRRRFLRFWVSHPNYTALVHTALGMGLGILAQGFVESGYVNSVGYALVFLGVLGHLYALVSE